MSDRFLDKPTQRTHAGAPLARARPVGTSIHSFKHTLSTAHLVHALRLLPPTPSAADAWAEDAIEVDTVTGVKSSVVFHAKFVGVRSCMHISS